MSYLATSSHLARVSFGGLTGVCCRTHKLEKEKSVAFAKETGTGLPFCGVGGFTHTIPQQAYGPSANARPDPQEEAVGFEAAIAAGRSRLAGRKWAGDLSGPIRCHRVAGRSETEGVGGVAMPSL